MRNILKYPFIMAPLAGLTDIVYRKIIDEFQGCGLMVSEMISVEGLKRLNEKTLKMMESEDIKTPQYIQLFGSNPKSFKEAGKIVEKMGYYKGIDINLGCPARKVIKKGAGSALLSEPQKIVEIIQELKSSSSLPVSVKIRLGINDYIADKIIEVLNKENISAITVHFRFQTTKYSEPSDWSCLKQLRDLCKHFFIVNGDIKSIDNINDKLQKSDAVMIGRGALYDPLIFRKASKIEVSNETYRLFIQRLIELIDNHYEEKDKLLRLKAYTRFFAYNTLRAKKNRKAIHQATTFKEAALAMEKIFDLL